MNNDRWLAYLQPKTLAYLVRDLMDRQEDWDFYPEDAPNETEKKVISQIIEKAKHIGTEACKAETFSFEQLLEQAEVEHEGWQNERDQQEQQNWLKDYE
ncbi:MAG: hypothetical protein AAF485_10260 [Chloroflexota bacterium]